MKNLISNQLNGVALRALFSLTVLLTSSLFSVCQNVGIGVENPTEKLQVGGIVHSVADGFRFPDGTIQTTASSNFEPQEAGDNRWFAVLKCIDPPISGSFNFDTIQNGIKIISYQWGMTSSDAGGGSSNIAINKLIVMKNIDASTNPLLQRALIGSFMNELRLYLYREHEGGIQSYYWVYLYNVIIREFYQDLSYKGGEQYFHIENISFEFEDAHWFYDDGVVNNGTEWPLP